MQFSGLKRWVTHRTVRPQSINSHFTPLEEPITTLLAAGYGTVHFCEKQQFLTFKT